MKNTYVLQALQIINFHSYKLILDHYNYLKDYNTGLLSVSIHTHKQNSFFSTFLHKFPLVSDICKLWKTKSISSQSASCRQLIIIALHVLY